VSASQCLKSTMARSTYLRDAPADAAPASETASTHDHPRLIAVRHGQSTRHTDLTPALNGDYCAAPEDCPAARLNPPRVRPKDALGEPLPNINLCASFKVPGRPNCFRPLWRARLQAVVRSLSKSRSNCASTDSRFIVIFAAALITPPSHLRATSR
jgi:hypothetical protein